MQTLRDNNEENRANYIKWRLRVAGFVACRGNPSLKMGVATQL